MTVEDTAIDDLAPPPRAKSRAWMIRLVSIATVAGAWEVIGRRTSPLFLSYPTAIVKAGAAMIASGELAGALASSLQTVVVGFFTAAAFGIVLGLLIGRYRTMDAATDWLINALYATPL